MTVQYTRQAVLQQSRNASSLMTYHIAKRAHLIVSQAVAPAISPTQYTVHYKPHALMYAIYHDNASVYT